MYLDVLTLISGTYILKICENQHLYSHLQMLSKDIIILADYTFSAIEVIYFFV